MRYVLMELDAILMVLLSWASHLSGYPMPSEPPEVRFEEHAFFVEHACGGRECNVAGWYNDSDVVYIDEQHRALESELATSLVVHEFTHYLQHQSGNFESRSCSDSVAREREAYRVQNSYLIEAVATINIVHPRPMSCDDAVAGMAIKSSY